jgi:hypothetical protein
MSDAKKAAEEYSNNFSCYGDTNRFIEDGFLAGAAWQAEQDKAEIAKLREALKKIESLTIWNNQSLEQDFHDANSIATKALAEKKGTE